MSNINSYALFNRLKLNRIYDDIARPYIIADNLRTPENMGSVLRLAGNIGAAKVLFIKDANSDDVRNWKIRKTASGADEKVDWSFCTLDELFEMIPGDYVLTAIETADDADNVFETTLPSKVAFIVGHEVYGISDALLEKVQKTVFIPVPGVISSLNVTHALSVVLFEWLRQMMLKINH